MAIIIPIPLLKELRFDPSTALLQKSAKPTNESSPPIHGWDRDTD